MILPLDEAGSGPAVVLLHSSVADRTMWAEHLVPLAAAGHRAVAVDIQGYGEAAPVAGELAEWRDVLETMDELSIERAALVGNSFGAAVALRVPLVAPERVSAMALIAASTPALEAEPSPQLEAAYEAEEGAVERGDVEAAVAAVLEAWTLPGAPQELRDRIEAARRRSFALKAGAPETTDAPDPLELDPGALARLEMPVLAATGEHDFTDYLRGAEALAETIPRGRHAVIEGAGHLAPLETPEAFRELLLEFLGDVELEA